MAVDDFPHYLPEELWRSLGLRALVAFAVRSVHRVKTQILQSALLKAQIDPYWTDIGHVLRLAEAVCRAEWQVSAEAIHELKAAGDAVKGAAEKFGIEGGRESFSREAAAWFLLNSVGATANAAFAAVRIGDLDSDPGSVVRNVALSHNMAAESAISSERAAQDVTSYSSFRLESIEDLRRLNGVAAGYFPKLGPPIDVSPNGPMGALVVDGNNQLERDQSLVELIDELLELVKQHKQFSDGSEPRRCFDELDRQIYIEACRLQLRIPPRIPGVHDYIGKTNLPGYAYLSTLRGDPAGDGIAGFRIRELDSWETEIRALRACAVDRIDRKRDKRIGTKLSSIFICYRRTDSQDVSGRIYDRLTQYFGKEAVFKDVENTPPGVHFPSFLCAKLSIARAILVVIGPTWLTATDSDGTKRLDDPTDYVRIEIETAFRLGILTIPITVTNAMMPRESELPESIRRLAFLNACQVRPDPDFDSDVIRLVQGLGNVSD